jgi:hypothetical protein
MLYYYWYFKFDLPFTYLQQFFEYDEWSKLKKKSTAKYLDTERVSILPNNRKVEKNHAFRFSSSFLLELIRMGLVQ